MRSVPKYIREHLELAMRHSQRMTEHISAVELWISSQGMDPEDFRLDDGMGLEEIELGIDAVDQVMHALATRFTPDDDLYGGRAVE